MKAKLTVFLSGLLKFLSCFPKLKVKETILEVLKFKLYLRPIISLH